MEGTETTARMIKAADNLDGIATAAKAITWLIFVAVTVAGVVIIMDGALAAGIGTIVASVAGLFWGMLIIYWAQAYAADLTDRGASKELQAWRTDTEPRPE